MHRHAFFAILLISLLGLGTAYLIVRQDPEESYVRSGDGVVTITGLARSTLPFAIEERVASSHSVLMDVEYVVTPDSVVLDVPAVLTFAVDDPAVPAVVYHYRTDILMWEPVYDVVANEGGVLAVEVRQLGRFRLGVPQRVMAPDFLAVYDELRDGAPASALGYTIAVGYAREGEERIRLANAGEQGGCNGAVVPGESEARSTAERMATVLVDDVQTTIAFTFLAQWFVSGATTCPGGSPFKPSTAYGILPTS